MQGMAMCGSPVSVNAINIGLLNVMHGESLLGQLILQHSWVKIDAGQCHLVTITFGTAKAYLARSEDIARIQAINPTLTPLIGIAPKAKFSLLPEDIAITINGDIREIFALDENGINILCYVDVWNNDALS